MGLYVERGLSVEDLCAEKCDIFESLVQKYFCSPLTKIYVRKTTNILRIFEFTKVSGRTSVLYFFMKNHLSLTQS